MQKQDYTANYMQIDTEVGVGTTITMKVSL